MKKLLRMMIAAAILVATTTACSNEELLENISPVEKQEVSNTQPKETFIFKYKGIQYFAEYEVIDSVMVIKDSTLANIIRELDENPSTATLTYPDGMVEYFDSNKELNELIETESISDNNIGSTRGLNPGFSAMTLKVYEHTDFGGRVLTYNGPTFVTNMKNANNSLNLLSSIDFNDIISSFQLTGNFVSTAPNLPDYPGLHRAAIVTFYKDPDYKSGSKSFKIDINNKQVSHNNFTKIDFNDKVSSIKLSWSN